MLNRLNKNTTADSAFVNNLLNRILDSMVMVCANSAGPLQPYGNSTVNPSYAGQPKSFESVIRNVLTQNGIVSAGDSNYFCNPYSIDFPKPFGKNPPLLVNFSGAVDTCACRRISTLKLEAKAAGFDTVALAAMNQFLLGRYKDSLTAVVWQGLQKCSASLYKDTCYTVITVPVCPPPVIRNVMYLESVTSTNNVKISYSTPLTSNACSVTVSDAGGNTVSQAAIPCGSNASAILSLPKCTRYQFLVSTVGNNDCTAFSGTAVLSSSCTGCPPTPHIISAAYTDTGSVNNVSLTYSLGASSTNSKISVLRETSPKVFSLYALFPLIVGSTSLVVSLPGCEEYIFKIYTGTPGSSCYDSSATVTLAACERVCKTLYTPIPLGGQAVLPAFLACDYQRPCISCTTLTGLVTEFRSLYPAYNAPYTDTLTITDRQLSQNSLLARFLNYRTGFSRHAGQYLAALKSCEGGGTPDTLCAFVKPVNDTTGVFTADTVPCRAVQTQAAFIAQLIYQQRRDSLIANFDSLYMEKCLGAKYLEQFYATYQPKEYHYTLYYYDQAGNLVKTLPPLAVKPKYDTGYLSQVRSARNAGNDLVNANNNELLATHYRYNSLNVVIAQRTPDAGKSEFWYDRLGRLTVSQNAKQATGKYSYTLYDALGRIIEVGQKPQATVMKPEISRDSTALRNWMNGGGVKEEMTVTRYDTAFPPIAVTINNISALYQNNLRNRVSYTYIRNIDGGDALAWDAATFYSYDIHGNVDTLLQDYRTGMGSIKCAGDQSGKNRYKKIVYSYDLISGKVNDVAYQPGWDDQYYHHYEYDAENRITEVRTSRDKIYWEREAAYTYYRHGPLARTVLGQNQVQGIDYAYTLQGWLKGVNSTADPMGGTIGSGNDCGVNTAVNDLVVNRRLAPYGDYTARSSITFDIGFNSLEVDSFETFIEPSLAACPTTTGIAGDNAYGGQGVYDMGQDGLTNAAGAFVNTNRNLQTADVYGFSLNYFNGDYKPVNASVTPFAILPSSLPPDTNGVITGRQLFNGNIAAMAVNIPKLGNAMLYGYSYDQLNRIVRMNAFTGLNNTNNSFTLRSTNNYHEEVTYDPNGNITSYFRNGVTQLAMDSLIYQYEKNAAGQVLSNKLRYVHDRVPNGNYTEDINSQTALMLNQVLAEKSASVASDHYQYDAIGNLIKDSLNTIEWTVYGKIKSITKGDGTIIKYTYDAAGNRISKIVSTGDSTYYVRDATGNVMSIYTKKGALTLSQTELHLYGSSRLGVYNVNVDVQNCALVSSAITTFTRGNKLFELSNHLGNVLVTVSDKRIQHTVDNTSVDYYVAEVITANDYYPFGMQMPGRNYNGQGAKDYRYGFNGKENDSEVKGEGNQQDYGTRIYDTRLGKWLSLDPLMKKYPSQSPYNYCVNNPIKLIDVDGRDVGVKIDGNTITFSNTFYIQGGDAKLLANLQNQYNKEYKDKLGGTYTDANGKTYNVKFEMSFKLAKAQDVARLSSSNIAEASSLVTINNSGGTFSNGIVGGNTISMSGAAARDVNTYLHEGTHNMGLQDRYDNIKFVDGKFRVNFNTENGGADYNNGYGITESGFEGDILGGHYKLDESGQLVDETPTRYTQGVINQFATKALEYQQETNKTNFILEGNQDTEEKKKQGLNNQNRAVDIKVAPKKIQDAVKK